MFKKTTKFTGDKENGYKVTYSHGKKNGVVATITKKGIFVVQQGIVSFDEIQAVEDLAQTVYEGEYK